MLASHLPSIFVAGSATTIWGWGAANSDVNAREAMFSKKEKEGGKRVSTGQKTGSAHKL